MPFFSWPTELLPQITEKAFKVSAGKSVLFPGNTQCFSGVIGSCVKGRTRKKAQQSTFKFLESHQSPDLIMLEQETEESTVIPGALVSELLGNIFSPLIL